MPCYSPIGAWYGGLTNSGKSSIVFRAPSDDRAGRYDLDIPCGQCIGCRLERSRQWAVRCVHESSCHFDNSFITLTFSDENVPKNFSVSKRDVQLFMKRLRKQVGVKVSFFACGEYGEYRDRPHYHVCLFGVDFSKDRYLWRVSDRGDRIYRSASLEKLWTLGICEIGQLTFESAAYVARYICEKLTEPDVVRDLNFIFDDPYAYFDSVTGEYFSRSPEFMLCSRRPAIGARWLDKFFSDVFPDDFVVARGIKSPPPRFYRRKHEELFPLEAVELKAKRIEFAKLRELDNTQPRLRVRKEVRLARISTLKRPLK